MVYFPKKRLSGKLLSVIFLLLIFRFNIAGENIELTFSRPLPGNATIDFITSADTRINYSFDYVNQPQRRIYTGQNNPVQIDKGTSSASFTIDNPEYIIKLDLSYNPTALAGKLTGVSISGLSALKSVDVSSQAISQPLNVPDGCTVIYGTQEPIAIEVLDDNIIDLSSHSHQSWNIEWSFDETTPVDANYIEKLPGGLFRFNNNFETPVKATLTHPSGLKLTTNYVIPNKLLDTFATLQLDGRGTGTLARFIAGQTNTDFIIKINESTGSGSGLVDLNLPSLSGYSGTLEIKSNHPEYITAIFLENLGIYELETGNTPLNLEEIHLSGNSLLPSALPAFLNNLEYVFLGRQNPFTLSAGSEGNTFDLKDQLSAGATVEWLDENDNIINPTFYENNDGIYTFTGFNGSAKAHLTLERFKDYEIFSEPVVIDRDLQPVMNISWAGAALPATITLGSSGSKNVKVYVGESEYIIPTSGKVDIRLPSSSGSAAIMADYPEQIMSINIDNINAYALNLSETLTSMEYLSVDNNRFTPFSLPEGIPTGCYVNWGNQAELDISGYVAGSNSVDLFAWRNLNIRWFHYDTNQPVKESYITEKTGYYTFGNVGKIYALVTIPEFAGPIFRTTPLTISSSFYPVISFSCNGDIDIVTGQFFVNAPTEFEIAGKLTEPAEGILTLNFSNGTIGEAASRSESGNRFFTLNSTNPENILSIALPAMGITSINVESSLTNLEYLDLGQNNLIFKTFPDIPEGCYANFANQKPVLLTVNTATGHVDMSDFSDCKIDVVDSGKYPLDSQLWNLDDDNGGVTFLSTVEDVMIRMNHENYPGITLYSVPLSYSKISGLNDIRKPSFELRGRTISLPSDVGATVYNTVGQTILVIRKGESVDMKPGTYVITLTDGNKSVIFIH